MIHISHIRHFKTEFFPLPQGQTILQEMSAGAGGVSLQAAHTVLQLSAVQCSRHDPGQPTLLVSAECRLGQTVSALWIRFIGTVHEIKILPFLFPQRSVRIFPQFLRQIPGSFLSALDLLDTAAVLGIFHRKLRK